MKRLAAVSVLGAVVLALLAGSAAGGPAADPIVGSWSRPGSGGGSSGGVIEVVASGTGFLGIVRVAYPSSNGCPHPVGQQVWEIQGAGGSYTGWNHGFADAPPACTDQRQATTWKILSATELEACVGGFGCSTYTRPAPADSGAPTVHAFGATAAANATVTLRFSVNDDSGTTRGRLIIYRSDKSILSQSTWKLGAVKNGNASVKWRPPKGFFGQFRFCVQAWDAAGNASAQNCATVSIGSAVPCSASGHGIVTNQISGTNGNDVLTGTPGPDLICGGNGDDVIRGGGGDDVIVGGYGADRLYGQAGNDYIDAHENRERDTDRVSGGPGSDKAVVSAAFDRVSRDVENVTVCGQIFAGARPPDCRHYRG